MARGRKDGRGGRRASALLGLLVAFSAALSAAGCENEANRSGTDPELDDPVGGSSSDGGGPDKALVTASGFSLRAFSPPPANPGKAAVLFTVSGEALATEGFAFPPGADQEITFVDGWDVRFDQLIVTVDALSLANGADTDPSDQGTVGAVVAQADGPWAVDLARNDPAYPAAKGGEGKAIPLAALTAQNRAGNGAFDTVGTRYALGYKTIPATAAALNVNLGPEALAEYEAMAKDGCSILYVGTATWRGDQGGTPCVPAAGGSAVLDGLPKLVRFRLCFKAPSEYVNCQNPDNDPATPLGGEEHQRGVAFKDNTFTTAQLTLHPDHAFWISVEEDSPATFDQFAAAAVASAVDGGVATVTLADLARVDYSAIKDRAGAPVPWRNCVGANFTPPPGNMSFVSGSVQNVGPSGDPKVGLRHLADFATYITGVQGHLNADGVCFTKRSYDSPN